MADKNRTYFIGSVDELREREFASLSSCSAIRNFVSDNQQK